MLHCAVALLLCCCAVVQGAGHRAGCSGPSECGKGGCHGADCRLHCFLPGSTGSVSPSLSSRQLKCHWCRCLSSETSAGLSVNRDSFTRPQLQWGSVSVYLEKKSIIYFNVHKLPFKRRTVSNQVMCNLLVRSHSLSRTHRWRAVLHRGHSHILPCFQLLEGLCRQYLGHAVCGTLAVDGQVRGGERALVAMYFC